MLRSGVVYEFKCRSCNASYIGQTKRHLATRIAEHRGISVRTNRRVLKPLYSAIRDHSLDADHVFSKEDFRVLHTSTLDTERSICESLLAAKLKPALCHHDTSTPLLCF